LLRYRARWTLACEKCGTELGDLKRCPRCRSRELDEQIRQVRETLARVEAELQAIREEEAAVRQKLQHPLGGGAPEAF
jgi:primosomal protein N'